MKIFKTQNIDCELRYNNQSKQRTLGIFDLTLMSVGAVIGTGVLVLTGIVAAKDAGPAIALSFIGGGIVSSLVVLCYAELASTIPSAGGSYTFTYVSLGEIIAYIVGICVVIGYTLSTAAIASGWGAYLLSLLDVLGITLPKAITNIPSDGGLVNLPAIFSIVLVTFVLTRGAKESKKFNDAMVLIKIGVILLFLVVGVFFIHPSNWKPFIPFGSKGVLVGAATVFFAYTGFDATASAAEEVKNPQKALPIGLLTSLVICTLIYISVSLVLTGITSYKNLNVADALSYALKIAGQPYIAFVVSTGAVIGMLAVIFAGSYATSHILLAMGRDGLVPKVFSKVDKNGTPQISLWIIGIVASFLSGFINLKQLADFANCSFLVVYSLVSLAVITLRKRYPNLQRGFKTPLVPFIPIIASLSCVFLMINLSLKTWIIFFIILIFAIISYFLYGIKHSIVNNINKK